MDFIKEKPLDTDNKKLDQSTILKLIKARNIAAILPASELTGLGQTVLSGYEIDKSSRDDWEKLNKEAMKLANQSPEKKSFPWDNAANVKYPLITTSSIQFHARAYPAIIQGRQVAKGVVNGFDLDGDKKERADRIGKHISYQLLEEMDDWEEETDKLLLNLAIVGCCFRKTYFDKSKGKNCSTFIPAEHLIVNNGAKTIESAPRITQEFELYKNEIEERERAGTFIDVDIYETSDDEDAPVKFLEQHCWADLDEDDYKEPYIITVHKDSGQVVRIVPRYSEGSVEVANGVVSKINPDHYFTKYSFIPNPDGGFYDIGLGVLLTSINETINTITNQILDAATKQNAGGGFIGSGLRLRSGNMRFSPGEYKPVNQTGSAIRENIYTMEHPGPSAVLFNMLGLLIEAGKDISSVKDILTGQGNPNETATSTLALIEQGQKVFTAIYKRIHRSLAKELKKIYRLNQQYLTPEGYFRYMDNPQPIALNDYQGDATDVTPISDPTMSTDAQEMARAEAYMRMVGDPYVNQHEIRRRYFKSLKEENMESVLLETPQPDPAQLQKQLQEMQEQGQQMQQEFGKAQEQFMQSQQQAQEEVMRLQAENQELKQQLGMTEAEKSIKAGMDALAAREVVVKEKEIMSDIAKVQSEEEALRIKKETELKDAQIQKTLAEADKIAAEAHCAAMTKEEMTSSAANKQEMFSHALSVSENAGAIAEGQVVTLKALQELAELQARPRRRTLIYNENGDPVEAVEVME